MKKERKKERKKGALLLLRLHGLVAPQQRREHRRELRGILQIRLRRLGRRAVGLTGNLRGFALLVPA